MLSHLNTSIKRLSPWGQLLSYVRPPPNIPFNKTHGPHAPLVFALTLTTSTLVLHQSISSYNPAVIYPIFPVYSTSHLHLWTPPGISPTFPWTLPVIVPLYSPVIPTFTLHSSSNSYYPYTALYSFTLPLYPLHSFLLPPPLHSHLHSSDFILLPQNVLRMSSIVLLACPLKQ